MTSRPEALPPLDSLPASYLLTPAEVAIYLRLDEDTLASWRRGARGDAGGPMFVRLGKGRRSPIRYRADVIRQWLADNTYDPSGSNGGESAA